MEELENEVPVQLFVTDVDGCLLPSGSQVYDLELLGRLAALNRAVRAGHTRFRGVTVATGRGIEYVEALGQVLGSPVPLIAEGGAFLVDLGGGAQCLLPEEDVELLAQARAALTGFLPSLPVPARLSPSKTVLVTVETAPHLGPEVARRVEEHLRARGWPLRAISTSSGFIDVQPSSLDKGKALAVLCQQVGVDPGEVLAVGDAGNDVGLLQRAGVPVAVGNATPQVQALARYVSPEASPEGMYDIFSRLRLTAETGWFRLEGAGG